MKISKRVQSVSSSVIVEIMMRAKQLQAQGVDIISFAVGEPDFDTPDLIKEAGKKAIDNGHTKYSHGLGIIELREAIARKLKEENGLDYDPSKQIAVTVGAKNALFQSLYALTEPNDDVLLPAPYWVTYPEMIKLTGAVPRIIRTSENNSYKLTPKLLDDSITAKSTVLILNYPNNPGGFCYTSKELTELAEVIEKSNLTVISDEIYEKLIYGKTKFNSFAAVVPHLFDRIVTINGFSKSYAMTGWRIGYAAGHEDIVTAIGKMQSQISLGTATFCQVGAIEALSKGSSEIEKMRSEFEKRAKYVYKRLLEIPGITCVEPSGAFYVFPNVSKLYSKLNVQGSLELCQLLLEKAKVACVPGISFGCDENIRLSFATSMQQIKEGMNRLHELLTVH